MPAVSAQARHTMVKSRTPQSYLIYLLDQTSKDAVEMPQCAPKIDTETEVPVLCVDTIQIDAYSNVVLKLNLALCPPPGVAGAHNTAHHYEFRRQRTSSGQAHGHQDVIEFQHVRRLQRQAVVPAQVQHLAAPQHLQIAAPHCSQLVACRIAHSRTVGSTRLGFICGAPLSSGLLALQIYGAVDKATYLCRDSGGTLNFSDLKCAFSCVQEQLKSSTSSALRFEGLTQG